MTIFKINKDFEDEITCDNCPFRYMEEDYDSCDEAVYFYCGLTQNYVGEANRVDGKHFEEPDDCPIISVEKE